MRKFACCTVYKNLKGLAFGLRDGQDAWKKHMRTQGRGDFPDLSEYVDLCGCAVDNGLLPITKGENSPRVNFL